MLIRTWHVQAHAACYELVMCDGFADEKTTSACMLLNNCPHVAEQIMRAWFHQIYGTRTATVWSNSAGLCTGKVGKARSHLGTLETCYKVGPGPMHKHAHIRGPIIKPKNQVKGAPKMALRRPHAKRGLNLGYLGAGEVLWFENKIKISHDKTQTST